MKTILVAVSVWGVAVVWWVLPPRLGAPAKALTVYTTPVACVYVVGSPHVGLAVAAVPRRDHLPCE